MKLLLIAIALTFCLSAMAEPVKPIDKTKPVYQLDWGIMPFGNCWFGGSWSERKQETYKLTPKERAAIEATATAAMYRKAAYWSWVAVGIACVGSYIMKAREGIGVAIICAGFSFASSFMAQTIHYGIRIGVCVLIAGAVALCYHPKVRDWSASNIFKKKEADSAN